MGTRLPINRSEVFYTATVLPLLALSNGPDGILPLLKAGDLQVPSGAASHTEVATEYAHWKTVAQHPDAWPTKAPDVSPDLLVAIHTDPGWLVGVEAKMFHRPSPAALNTQLVSQRKLLEAMAADLDGNYKVAQVLLVHADFVNVVKSGIAGNVTLLTWQQVLEIYTDASTHWRAMLYEAIDNYSHEKSKTVKILDGKIPGHVVAAGGHPFGYVGVSGGEAGLSEMVSEGDDWESRLFEVRYDAPPTSNRNWMSLSKFLAIVGK